jgi:hypothetical protein
MTIQEEVENSNYFIIVVHKDKKQDILGMEHIVAYPQKPNWKEAKKTIEKRTGQ